MDARRGWDRFWHRDVPVQRLAAFRLAVAWICLYDACLYDATHLVANRDGVEVTWNPLVVFAALGVQVPTAVSVAWCALAYKVAALCVMAGVRTRVACLAMALLAFWQGGVFYSLTKVRHDRVALCFATFALALAPCGRAFAHDARQAGGHEPSVVSAWPIRLVQVTIAIGYGAAGFAKVLQPGWLNGYTLQGIMLGHRGAWAGAVASNVLVCQLLTVITVAAQLAVPLCLWWPRLVFWLLPALIGFHLGTWATMDTGPYMTLWAFWIAFVPLDDVWPWWSRTRRQRPWLAWAALAFGAGTLAVMAVVFVRVVPWPWWLAGVAITLFVVRDRRPGAPARALPATV